MSQVVPVESLTDTIKRIKVRQVHIDFKHACSLHFHEYFSVGRGKKE